MRDQNIALNCQQSFHLANEGQQCEECMHAKYAYLSPVVVDVCVHIFVDIFDDSLCNTFKLRQVG